MTRTSEEWQALAEAFSRFSRHIDQARTVHINANSLKTEAMSVAQQYFRRTRPALEELGLREQLAVLDDGFQRILELASGRNAASSYKVQNRLIRKAMPTLTSRIETSRSVVKRDANGRREDERIIETLEGLVPSAALSYKQAIVDLADDTRFSFRGPALELRECRRETLDHLAPDDAVTNTEGYIQEKGRGGPTMKQKVRFILKSRGQSKSASAAPQQATSTIDEMIGSLARSIYDRSSVATHIASERKAVDQIRRYVAAVLHDILEI